MSLNPDTQAFVDMIEAARASAPPVAEQTPEFARNRYRALAHVLGEGPELAGGIEELEIPRPGGSIGQGFIGRRKRGRIPFYSSFTVAASLSAIWRLTTKNAGCSAKEQTAPF